MIEVDEISGNAVNGRLRHAVLVVFLLEYLVCFCPSFEAEEIRRWRRIVWWAMFMAA